MRIKKVYAYSDIFNLTIEKAHEKWIGIYDTLGKILADGDRSALGEFSPTALADKLDRESAFCCDVEIYASCDSPKPLRDFLQQTLELAIKQQGTINENFMPMLSTEDKKDLIVSLDSEAGESQFISHLIFSFK